MGDEAYMPQPDLMPYEMVPELHELPLEELAMEDDLPLVDDLALAHTRLRGLHIYKGFMLRHRANIAYRRGQEERRLEEQRRLKRREKRWWVRPCLLNRDLVGQYHVLLRELDREDVGAVKNFARVNPQLFEAILQRIGHDIAKEDTNARKALEPGLKLPVTMRFLATGDSYHSLSYGFLVGPNTICDFLSPVCEAILPHFPNECMETPDTQREWRKIESVFRKKWNLPHCLGAIDGKHVAVWCPPKTGSEYFNYKSYYSIVLMAVVDGNYRFLNINVGAKGSTSDGGVFQHIDFTQDMEGGLLDIPPAEALPGGDPNKPVPYFFVADEAFPLKTWIMKPVPRRNLTQAEAIYNYRISRARRDVENAFGILAARFRCLLRPMNIRPEKAISVVIVCCVLHNNLRSREFRGPHIRGLIDAEDPDTHEVNPGLWRLETNMFPLQNRRGAYGDPPAKEVRGILMDYVNGPGAVPWQADRI